MDVMRCVRTLERMFAIKVPPPRARGVRERADRCPLRAAADRGPESRPLCPGRRPPGTAAPGLQAHSCAWNSGPSLTAAGLDSDEGESDSQRQPASRTVPDAACPSGAKCPVAWKP